VSCVEKRWRVDLNKSHKQREYKRAEKTRYRWLVRGVVILMNGSCYFRVPLEWERRPYSESHAHGMVVIVDVIFVVTGEIDALVSVE